MSLGLSEFVYFFCKSSVHPYSLEAGHIKENLILGSVGQDLLVEYFLAEK